MKRDVRRPSKEPLLDGISGNSANVILNLMAWPSNNGRKDSTGSVIAGKSSLDQARAVVTHKGGGLVVVTHGYVFLGWSRNEESQITYCEITTTSKSGVNNANYEKKEEKKENPGPASAGSPLLHKILSPPITNTSHISGLLLLEH